MPVDSELDNVLPEYLLFGADTGEPRSLVKRCATQVSILQIRPREVSAFKGRPMEILTLQVVSAQARSL